MSPDDHYREAERLLLELKEPATDPPRLIAIEYNLALAQVHATLALCVHPNITRSRIQVGAVVSK